MIPMGAGGLDLPGALLVVGVLICLIGGLMVLVALFGDDKETEAFRPEVSVLAAALLGLGIVITSYAWHTLGL